MFDHRIQNREQLAHTGDQSDFEKFALGGQTFVEVSNHGVASSGDQRRHVQSAAHRSSATPNGAPTLEQAAITVEGSQANQSRDLLAVECAKFRQLGEQRTAGHWAYTGGGSEQLFVLLPDGALTDATVKILVGPIEFFFQPADVSADAFCDSLGGSRQPVFLG